MGTRAFFPTLIYDAPLVTEGGERLRRMLAEECLQLRDVDAEGRRWCAQRYADASCYYTSYGSWDHMHRVSSTFMTLRENIDRHVARFARSLEYDLGDGRSLSMTDCWVNVMGRGATHGLHIHPTSTISGTYYVKVPRGASCIKFEDPRLTSLMAAPPRKPGARTRNQAFIEHAPVAGSVVLFESWLRHEVPTSRIAAERISISFNYGWF